MKISILIIAVLFSSAIFSQTNYSAATLEKIKEVENNITGRLVVNDAKPFTIDERMAQFKVKGLSIAVIKDYKIAWAKGYGWADEAEKKPVTTSTLFEPGSISKVLNAIGILKLAQDGKLDLNTDINTYLKSWKFPYDSLSKGKKITLAEILSHNAGLSVHGFPGHNIKGPIPTLLQVLDGIPPAVTPAVRSMYEPGLKYEYSGGGISISQLILTDITKQPYEQWMYDNVLKPIGMIHSSYAQPLPKDKQYLCASAYYADGAPVVNKFHVYPEQAAAGLWMTPSDLCNYVIDMQLAYQGKPSKVLNPEMVKLHLTPRNDGLASMGAFVVDHDGAKYFEHSAANDGFCGDFFGSLEDGNGVVIFLNNESGKIMPDIINSVAKAYNWKNFYQAPQHKTSIAVADDVIKNYEGIYLYDNQWAAVGKKDNAYNFYTNSVYAKMYFTSPSTFFNEEFQAVKTFTKDDKGNVTGYTRMVDGKEFPAAKKITDLDTLHLDNGSFADISWYLFETKNYKDAIAYLKRGSQLYPEDLNLTMNIAHFYLFNKDYKAAVDIYRAHQKDMIRPDYSFEKQMQDDYTYFKEHQYDVTLMEKVFAELKIDKPKGY